MQFFSSRGVRIAFIDVLPPAGDRGEPILLIHGFASTHAINWVNPGWVKTLIEAGRRVVALDNRGHGESDKPYDPAAYAMPIMASDARGLLDHLGIVEADVMGYSMGARIAAFLALDVPTMVRSLVFGGLGHHLVGRGGLPPGLAHALEAPTLDEVTDPIQRMFRAFAEASKSDLRALSACARGSRQALPADEVARIRAPALVAVGTKDEIAGDAHELAALLPNGRALDIPRRDHNLAVGDKIFKQGVLDFLEERV